MFQKRGVNLLLKILLMGFTSFAQPTNDACNSAEIICPNTTLSGSNYGSTVTVCPNCEDDYSFCFTNTNTVWYQFTSNTLGGSVTVSISNLAFNPQANRGNQLQAKIVEAAVQCDAATYTAVGTCNSGSSTNFSLAAGSLPPNKVYYIIINGTTNGGATLPAEATFDITVSGPGFDRPPIGISIGGPTGTVCPQTTLSFTTYLSNCADTSSFNWFVNGVLTAITTSSLWQTSDLAHGDVVSVSTSCFNQCRDTVNFTTSALVMDPLFVDAGLDQTVLFGTEVTLTGSSNGVDYSWAPSSNLSDPFSISTLTTANETTTYYLTASNANCTVVDQVTVFVSDVLTIPGSFSPNGDGVNDTWIIPGISFYPNTRITLFDRWGQVVTDIVGYNDLKPWDGTKNGKLVSDGVYFYVIDLKADTSSKPLKGSVTIIR